MTSSWCIRVLLLAAMLKAATGEEGGLFGSSDGSIGYPGNSGMYTSVTSYECCSERTEYDECILKLYLSQSRR